MLRLLDADHRSRSPVVPKPSPPTLKALTSITAVPVDSVAEAASDVYAVTPAEVAVPPVEFILFIGVRRGATTSISDAFGTHKCATSWNEFTFIEGNHGFSQGLPHSERGCIEARPCDAVAGGCYGTRWKQRLSRGHFVDVMQEARQGWCTWNKKLHPMCSKCGACVMAIKFHENMVKSRPLAEQLMAYPGTAVVVVERHDLDAQYCSLQYSMATGIWHGGNHGQQDKWTKAHCHPGTVRALQFKKSVTHYFQWAHSTLRLLKKTYLNMSFEAFIHDARGWEGRLHNFANLPAQQYDEACYNGCNCHG